MLSQTSTLSRAGMKHIEHSSPVCPGDVLRDYILSHNVTQAQLADAMKVSRLSVNQIINGRREVTAEMALRLAFVLSTSPDFWLNLQRSVDLYKARLKLAGSCENFRVLRIAPSLNSLKSAGRLIES